MNENDVEMFLARLERVLETNSPEDVLARLSALTRGACCARITLKETGQCQQSTQLQTANTR